MNMHVAAPVDSGDEKSCLVSKVVAPLDASEIQEQTFKLLQGLELISTLARTEKEKFVTTHESERCLDNIEFLASMLADTACQVLDNLPAVTETDSEPSVYESRGFIEL